MKRLMTIAMVLILGLTTQSWAAKAEGKDGKKDGQCQKGDKGKKGKGLSEEQREQVKNMSGDEKKEFFKNRRAGKGKKGGKKKDAAE